MVEDRWVHAARRLTSIEFSFDPCNVYRDGPRGVGYPADARSVGGSHPSCLQLSLCSPLNKCRSAVPSAPLLLLRHCVWLQMALSTRFKSELLGAHVWLNASGILMLQVRGIVLCKMYDGAPSCCRVHSWRPLKSQVLDIAPLNKRSTYQRRFDNRGSGA